jgi:2-keto-4-pentenoate hydratase
MNSAIEELGTRLARCRRRGEIAALPLDSMGSRAEAEAVQDAAVAAYGGRRRGYKIGATNAGVQHLLGCREPFFGPLFAEDMLESGATFRMVPGLLGIECEFAFVLKRACPAEAVSLESLRDAISSCHLALEVVGRRVESSVRLNEASAIADFALDVAYVHGPEIPDWRDRDLGRAPVTARVDGQRQAEGRGAEVLGDPLNALLWLARALAERNRRLEAGDIVSTGTCTGITPVAAGRRFRGDFHDLGAVELALA